MNERACHPIERRDCAMRRVKLFFTALMVLGLAFPVGSMIGDTGAEEIDYERGVIVSGDTPGGLEPQAITIDLTIDPNPVENNEVFTVTVNYSPYITGTWREKFIFKWPSTCDFFRERTIRKKKFLDYNEEVTGSFESVVAPWAQCIEGTFEAKVIVFYGTEIYEATTLMTVVNP
jgi:hypothetical protein